MATNGRDPISGGKMPPSLILSTTIDHNGIRVALSLMGRPFVVQFSPDDGLINMKPLDDDDAPVVGMPMTELLALYESGSQRRIVPATGHA